MSKFTLNQLRKSFYQHNQQSFAYLDFQYNQLEMTVFYDREQHSLLFVKKLSHDEFEITINNYFDIDISLDNKKYKQLVTFLEIKYHAGQPFKPKDFFKTFNDHFIWRTQSTIYERKYLNSRWHLEDPNAIYFQRIIDHRGKDNGHVTDKNRKKVKILLPKLYEYIKDYDISIGFTNKQSDAANDNQKAIIQQLQLSY